MELSFQNAKYEKLEKIKGKIRSFDLLSFRGGDFISDIIIILQRKSKGISPFSHVGMVVKSDILEEWNGYKLKEDNIYVLESTFSYEVMGILKSSPDVIKEKGIFGVQLRNLEDVIDTYISSKKTKIAWCKLIENPLDYKDINLIKDEFRVIFEKYYNMFYALSLLDLLGTLYPAIAFIRDNKKKLTKYLRKMLFMKKNNEWQFCSQLVANIYKDMGIASVNPNNITPSDFFKKEFVYSPIFFEKNE